MRLDITSIPVNDVFEPRKGCPICLMRDTLEERILEYITGAAMMEPDVRQETNKTGFCFDHYKGMLEKKNRLGVALILESHLKEMSKTGFNKRKMSKNRGFLFKNEEEEKECFVCDKIWWAKARMLETVCRLWEKDEKFRKMYSEQEWICLPHYHKLIETAEKKMNRKNVSSFQKETKRISKDYLKSLCSDVTHFSNMFDYRNSSNPDVDWGNSKNAIERSVEWLTTQKLE